MRRFAFILLIIILIMIHPVYANSFMINDQVQTKNFTSYIFKGWFLGNKKITNTKQLSQNTKLRAKWRKI